MNSKMAKETVETDVPAGRKQFEEVVVALTEVPKSDRIRLCASAILFFGIEEDVIKLLRR